MKTTTLFIIASLGLMPATSPAQAPPPAQTSPPTDVFYRALGVAGGAAARPVMVEVVGAEGMNGQPIAGKPVSATEQRHSLQVLGDGTRIEQSETSRFYRDDQGRTRIEHEAATGGGIVIQDPVGGFVAMLEPANKIARKMPNPAGAKFFFRSAPAGGPMFNLPVPPPGTGSAAGGPAGGQAEMQIKQRAVMIAGSPSVLPPEVRIKRIETSGTPPSSEDLGSQIVNGVTAQGTRTTLTIRAGEIGNDRDISVLSERWFSSDLQMIVKSSNKDPRFGDTTYQLTDIERSVPNPSLFQIPTDYTVQEGK